MTEQDFMKDIPKSLLSDEDFNTAVQISKENCLRAKKFIKEHAKEEIGFKMASWYYDLYIYNETEI